MAEPEAVTEAGERPGRGPTRRTFRAPWWLRGPHAQTVGGHLLRPTRSFAFRRERIETPDDDFIDLDWPLAPSSRGAEAVSRRRAHRRERSDAAGTADRPLVLVVHGLEGSARRGYMLAIYRALFAHGLRPVGLNLRSCSGEPNRAAHFYHSGETGDLRFVLDRLRAHAAGRPIGAVGFSLGGNMLVKMLGEDGEASAQRLAAAVAISVPFDLAAGADMLERGIMGRVYTRYFLKMLRAKTRAKADRLHTLCDVEAALRARTIRAFDDAVTAPLHGFAGAADYYERCSSGSFLNAVRVPTLVIHSRDDPFQPPRRVPEEAFRANPFITAAITDRGGHVGFVAGVPQAPRFWAEERAAAFLAGRLHARRDGERSPPGYSTTSR